MLFRSYLQLAAPMYGNMAGEVAGVIAATRLIAPEECKKRDEHNGQKTEMAREDIH